MVDTETRLARAPRLTPLLVRGALLSPLKRARPGATAPTTRLTVPDAHIDPARSAAYASLCGFDDAPDAPLPLTYPHLIGFPLAMRLMAARDFPLPVLGLVHTSIAITRRRDLYATETPEISVYVEELRPHRRGTEAVVTTRALSAGEPVWESRSTYLSRHAPPDTTPGAVPTAPGRDREPLPAVTDWHLPGDLGRRYGAASGDRNPIHLHPLTAKLFGFPRAIAHGMWTVARCLAEYDPKGPVQVHADFRAPVLLPAQVTYAAQGTTFELRGTTTGKCHVSGRVLPLD